MEAAAARTGDQAGISASRADQRLLLHRLPHHPRPSLRAHGLGSIRSPLSISFVAFSPGKKSLELLRPSSRPRRQQAKRTSGQQLRSAAHGRSAARPVRGWRGTCGGRDIRRGFHGARVSMRPANGLRSGASCQRRGSGTSTKSSATPVLHALVVLRLRRRGLTAPALCHPVPNSQLHTADTRWHRK